MENGIKVEFEKIRSEDLWMCRERKVGKHKRKLNGQEYVSPRIILSGDYNYLIGRKFRLYIAQGKITEKEYGREKERKGMALILFFEDVEDRGRAGDYGYEDEDDYDPLEEYDGSAVNFESG